MKDKRIESIFSLSPQQLGMLLETLSYPESGVHIEQVTLEMEGELSVSAFNRAVQLVVQRHPMLRTCFAWQKQVEPLQVVLRDLEPTIETHDWRDLQPAEEQSHLDGYLQADRALGFELHKPPLFRVSLILLSGLRYRVCWTSHHILMDGWSQAVVVEEFLAFYEALSKSHQLKLDPPGTYRDYVGWLQRQDLSEAESFWQEKLKGFQSPTALGLEGRPAESSLKGLDYAELAKSLPADATAALTRMARSHRLTLNTIVQGI